jgi:hypothetical protein
MVRACTATVRCAVPEGASIEIFAVWITCFARPGCHARWNFHSRFLRRSWALLFIEPTVAPRRNGGVMGSVTGAGIRQRDPPRARAWGARISSVITVCGRRSLVWRGEPDAESPRHRGFRLRLSRSNRLPLRRRETVTLLAVADQAVREESDEAGSHHLQHPSYLEEDIVGRIVLVGVQGIVKLGWAVH